MTIEDLKKCKKNGYCWSSWMGYGNIPTKHKLSSLCDGWKLDEHYHATREAAEAALAKRKTNGVTSLKPAYPPKAKQEADGWTQEEIDKAAFKDDSILVEAEKLVHGDRRRDYGTPDENFSRIARRWSAILGHPVTTTNVVECMIALKFARQEEKPKRDNWVDIAGYAQCGSELTTTKTK